MSATATWIVILTCAYMEYSTWHGRQIYRRTVGYEKRRVVLSAAGQRLDDSAANLRIKSPCAE